MQNSDDGAPQGDTTEHTLSEVCDYCEKPYGGSIIQSTGPCVRCLPEVGTADLVADGGRVAAVTFGMTFADEHVENILAGEKTLTARIGSDWRPVSELDGLKIWAANGAFVTDAVVQRAQTMTAAEAYEVVNSHSGHRSYDSLEAFLDAMRGYYPDKDVDQETDIRLINFEVDDDE